MKLIDLLKHSVAKYPDKTAVIDSLCQISYIQLLENSLQISNILKSANCTAGVKVAVALPKGAAYFASFFAASACQATIVAMSSKITAYEAVNFIARSDVSIIITTKNFAIKLAKHLGNTVSILVIEPDISSVVNARFTIKAKPKIDISNKDVALMVYTSGSTGLSKIVMLTDGQLISNMFSYRSVVDFDRPNIVYCSLPLYHIYCICAQILTHISYGDTFIAKDRPFFIKDFFKDVEQYSVTISAFVPYMAILMAEFPKADKFDLISLKYITLSGAKTPKSVYQKLVKTFRQVKFVNTYGMSEAGSRISIAAPKPEKFPTESVGKPIPSVTVRITRNKTILPADSVGSIEIKSTSIFKGYYNQPTLTRETIVDGWLKTGDLGKLDTDGNLYLMGREKDIILSGGENIYPSEIEEVLIKCNFIREATVISIPDKKLQEVPCAFIVLKDESVNQTDIINFCRKKLSSLKIPQKIIFTDKLPRLNSSKVNKKQLRQIAINKSDKLEN